jgi:hypothetical protein
MPHASIAEISAPGWYDGFAPPTLQSFIPAPLFLCHIFVVAGVFLVKLRVQVLSETESTDPLKVTVLWLKVCSCPCSQKLLLSSLVQERLKARKSYL